MAVSCLTLAIWSAWLSVARGVESSTDAQYLPISGRAFIGSEAIDLEVARSPEERALGLMFRPALPDDRGMWFPMEPARPARMWMKNVPVALDMVFLRRGRVVQIADEVPPCNATPCPIYGTGHTLVDGVLELRAGRARELGLKLGDSIRIQE